MLSPRRIAGMTNNQRSASQSRDSNWDTTRHPSPLHKRGKVGSLVRSKTQALGLKSPHRTHSNSSNCRPLWLDKTPVRNASNMHSWKKPPQPNSIEVQP